MKVLASLKGLSGIGKQAFVNYHQNHNFRQLWAGRGVHIALMVDLIITTRVAHENSLVRLSKIKA